MVPEERLADAQELLSEFRKNDVSATSPPLPWLDRLRVVLEGVLFGWLVPGARKDKKARPWEDHDA
jgi:hypothetical protein